MTDPLRALDVVLALALALGTGSSIVLSVARDGQRLRLAGTAILAVALVGGQLRAMEHPYTWVTWALALGLAVSVAGMARYLGKWWTVALAGGRRDPS